MNENFMHGRNRLSSSGRGCGGCLGWILAALVIAAVVAS